MLRSFLVGVAALALLPGPAQARDPLPSFASVLRRAEPAVVNIATGSRESEPAGEPETMQDLLQRFLGEPPPQRQSLGSGFVVSAAGEIVTNMHVVEGADRIRVRLATDEELDAKVIGRDEKTDIALLRVQAPRPLTTLAFGDSDALEVGDWVVAIGNPFGLAQTATAGIVSAKGRALGAGPYDDFIQTDASINPGNSGGPLIDQEGRVVGVNAAIVSPAGGNVGIGFAIPATLVRWVVDQLREHGRVVRGWIGVTVQPVTPELARSFQLPAAEGALVADVAKKSPAAKAGIQRGDVIVRFGERPIHHSRELPTQVAGTAPKTRVPVTVLRAGEKQTVDVTVAELEPEPPRTHGPSESEEWGLTLATLPAADAQRLGLPAGVGVQVLDVVEGSPADDAELEPGDVVLQVDRKRVNSPAAFWKAVSDRPQVLLLVRRGSESLYVELTR